MCSAVKWTFVLILYAQTCGNIIFGSSVIDVTIDTSLKSWTEASVSGTCQLAAGTQSSEVYLSSLTFNLTDSGLPTAEVWIGATVAYSGWLELQSCNYGKENDPAYRYDISKSPDPAETCLEKCGNAIFYLTNEWCYCSAGVTYSEISSCNVISCPNDRFCGSQSQIFSTFTYHCMCKYAPVTIVEDNVIGECKKVVHDDEGNVTIVTADCEEQNPVLCRHLESGTQYIPGGISRSWAVSAAFCNAEGAIISGVDSTRFAFNGNYIHWIGVFRIAHVTWETNHSGIPTYCLSVIVGINGTATMKVRDCSTLLPSLCEIIPPVTVTLSQEQTTSVLASSSTPQATTMDSNISGQITTMAASVSPTDKTGLIVGIVLAVIVGLALVALTQYFITKRRRKRNEIEERNRLGSLKKLPHSLRKAGEENKLSFMETGNEPHLYNDLHELRQSKTAHVDMYDHVETGRGSMNLYSELNKNGHRQKDTEVTTYDTMASINAERDAGQERPMVLIPSPDNDTSNSTGEV